MEKVSKLLEGLYLAGATGAEFRCSGEEAKLLDELVRDYRSAAYIAEGHLKHPDFTNVLKLLDSRSGLRSKS